MKGSGYDRAWKLGLTISGVEDTTYWGLPALKLNGRMVACVAGHAVDDADTLVIPVTFERRDELLASDPDTFYVTDHYVKYPAVLVRLESVDVKTLRGLLEDSCRAAAAMPPPRPRRKRSTRPRSAESRTRSITKRTRRR